MPFFVAFVYYFALSGVLGEISGIGSNVHQVATELPIMLLLHWFFLSLQKPLGLWKTFAIAILPVTLSYIAYDVYYHVFGRFFTLSELVNFTELFRVMPWYQLSALFLYLVFPFLILTLIKKQTVKRELFFFCGGASLVFLLIVHMPAKYIAWLKWTDPTLGDFYSVSKNGRFASILYFEAKRQIALQQLENITPALDEERLSYYQGLPVKHKPDVFIVVLESFLYPTFFKSLDLPHTTGMPVKFSEPYHSNVVASQSPVFGGGTPRPEFEVLCGLQSRALYAALEFNLMQHGGLSCLPNILNSWGYLTIATYPSSPRFYNAKVAYGAMGFDDVNFLKVKSGALPSYLDIPEPVTGNVYDGDVFKKNIEYVKQQKEKHHLPIFSYIMTLYGHHPFEQTPEQNDRLFGRASSVDASLQNSLNLSSYTIRAIQDYLADIAKISDDYVVVFVGDHAPPFETGTENYRRYDYLNQSENSIMKTAALVVVNGEPIELPKEMKHFMLFNEVLEQILQQALPASDRLESYQSMMSKTIKGSDNGQ